VVCILLATPGMPSTRRRPLPCITVCFLLTLADPARAQSPSTPLHHVRPESSLAHSLVAEATARSTTIHTLVDRLEHSDVIVYIRHAALRDSTLDGRVRFVTSAGGWRYLVIELACLRVPYSQIETLGHELQHAVEIAEAPSVVDTKTLAQHYRQIGKQIAGRWNSEVFETRRAVDTAARVRRELLASPLKTTEEQ